MVAIGSDSDRPVPTRKTPPPPRDFWVFDQVVRRRRREVDVADDLCLSQPRISQICREVHAWYARVQDECLPQVPEARVRAIEYLAHLRCESVKAGLVPAGEDPYEAITRLLEELTGLYPREPKAKQANVIAGTAKAASQGEATLCGIAGDAISGGS